MNEQRRTYFIRAGVPPHLNQAAVLRYGQHVNGALQALESETLEELHFALADALALVSAHMDPWRFLRVHANLISLHEHYRTQFERDRIVAEAREYQEQARRDAERLMAEAIAKARGLP